MNLLFLKTSHVVYCKNLSAQNRFQVSVAMQSPGAFALVTGETYIKGKRQDQGIQRIGKLHTRHRLPSFCSFNVVTFCSTHLFMLLLKK